MSTFYDLMANLPSEEPEENASNEAPNEGPQGYSPNLDIFADMPDGWKPQQSFATSEEELQFYRDRYPGLWKHINSDAFLDQFLNHYEGHIASKDEEMKAVAKLIKSLNENPEEFIAAHLPEYAERMGVGKIFSADEIGQYIDEKIAEEFGENWRDVYNPADLVRRNSVSSQILKRSQQLEDKLEQYNEKTRKNRESYLASLSQRQQQPQGQITEQQLDSILDQMIDGYFNELADTGLTQDEFIEMAIASFQHQPTVRDIYRVMHHDKIVEQERKKAYEAGRNAMLSEFKKGSKRAAMDFVPADEHKTEHRPKSLMGLRFDAGL